MYLEKFFYNFSKNFQVFTWPNFIFFHMDIFKLGLNITKISNQKSLKSHGCYQVERKTMKINLMC